MIPSSCSKENPSKELAEAGGKLPNLEAIYSSGTLGSLLITRLYNPEDLTLQNIY
jgi:hypothetical protein